MWRSFGRARILPPFVGLRASLHSSHVARNGSDIRTRLKTDLKTAMKAKDQVASTTIRSVLAEIVNADKASPSPVKDATIYGLLRKSVARRNDAAGQFRAASREDLAEKEETEATLLQQFLPPTLSEADIDRLLAEAVAEVRSNAPNPDSTSAALPSLQQLLGKVLKSFWGKAPQGTGSISGDVIARKAKELLA